MAFNAGDRFPPICKHEYYRLSDPGSYQNGSHISKCAQTSIKAPFLSKAPRQTNITSCLWTHAIYNAALPSSIPNCASFMSKTPRFPYEALSKEDIEEILCKCGINVCECCSDENVTGHEQLCQAQVARTLFKGHPPRSPQGEGLSIPGKSDQGFVVCSDGSRKRIRKKFLDPCPPYYDTRVNESTAFYQGCKWSCWTSKRSQISPKTSPGPADYYVQKIPTQSELCLEALRSYHKRISKQPRFSCNPAVCRGPLVRTKRFHTPTFQTPAPNEYNVGRGLETVLSTHNKKLKNNIEKQHKFHCKPQFVDKTLTFEQRESILINKCMKLLESETENKVHEPITKQEKMLRYFLYSHPMPVY